MANPWAGPGPLSADAPPPQENSGLRLADILPFIAAAGAGVATGFSPRYVGQGVQAGLGTFMALNEQRQKQKRLADELAGEKQNKEQFNRNFGQLVDYYSPRGVPSIRPEDMPADATPQERADPAGTWLKSQGYPEHAMIDSANGPFLKMLAQINPTAAMARFDQTISKEQMPGTVAEAQAGLGKLAPGQSYTTKLGKGGVFTAKGDAEVQDAEKTLIEQASRGITTGPVVDAAKSVLASKNIKTPFSVMNDLISKGVTSGPQFENAKSSFALEHPGLQPPSTQLAWDKNANPVAFDPKSRTVAPITMIGGAGAPAPNAATMGDPGAMETVAQSLAKGDLTRMRDVTSYRGDQRSRLYARVLELNPNFSQAQMDRKIKMEDSVTNGKDGQQIQSFGTFLEHAGEASDVINGIYQSASPAVNKPLNYWRKNLSGSPEYQQLITALEPVRKEFEGFLLGGRALYGDDRQKAETILSDNSSPAQIMSALKQMGKTAKDRFNEINHRYQRVMAKDIADPFSPEAIDGAAKIGLTLGGGRTAAAPAGGPGIAPANRPPLSSYEK